jgi:hypothetical protein
MLSALRQSWRLLRQADGNNSTGVVFAQGQGKGPFGSPNDAFPSSAVGVVGGVEFHDLALKDLRKGGASAASDLRWTYASLGRAPHADPAL